MNSHRQRELWFKMRLALAHIGLALVSALVAVALSRSFGEPWKTVIRIAVFLASLYLIEIRVEKTAHAEGDP